MKKILFALLFALLPTFAYADFIAPPDPSSETNVSVALPDHCTVTDTDGVAHTYSGGYFGICAVETAIENGSISGASFSNQFPSFGLFITTIGGLAADESSQYWALYQNGTFASTGLTLMTLNANDTLTIELHDFADDYLGTRFTITISSLVASQSTSVTAPANGGGIWYHAPFDVPKAYHYLASVQGPDGSFGSPMLNDWAAIATAAGDGSAIKDALKAYELAHPVISDVITENERHAMALEALGIDPRHGTSVDYIAPIVNSFDGTQIGDPTLVNDDIFAIFPLLHAGYSLNDPMMASTTKFIIAEQENDGSWAESVDLTTAAIQALRLLPDTGENRFVISKATGYLHGKQHPDGGFGEPYSSSWVLQAIAAMNGTSSDWQQEHLTPDYYLATQQDDDGGVIASSTQDRIWATSYAIPGIRRATWDSLLQTFPDDAVQPQVLGASTTTAASSTERGAALSNAATLMQEVLDILAKL